MTDLKLSERLRVAAAIDGPLTLELTHGQAAELIRICRNLEDNSEAIDKTKARLNAITARHEWLCRMNDEAVAPITRITRITRITLLICAAQLVVNIAKDLLN